MLLLSTSSIALTDDRAVSSSHSQAYMYMYLPRLGVGKAGYKELAIAGNHIRISMGKIHSEHARCQLDNPLQMAR